MTKTASRIRFKAKLFRPAESEKGESWTFLILPKNASAKQPKPKTNRSESCGFTGYGHLVGKNAPRRNHSVESRRPIEPKVWWTSCNLADKKTRARGAAWSILPTKHIQLISDAVPFDKIDIETITEERRKSVAKSIRAVGVEELKKLGDEVFHDIDDPWREGFFQFVAEHSHATIHYAIASDGVNMLYCRDEDRGIWFVPGTGKGILSPAGRQMMREAIEGRS